VDPSKLGVAAALWDGALVLAGYLVAQPQYRYVGEAAAGCGKLSVALVSIAMQQGVEAVVMLRHIRVEAN
jgi:hypothetical protein